MQPQRPQPPYVAEVIVAGSSSDVYPLGRHRDLPAAQQACQGDWRVYQPLAWRQTGPAKWSARPGEHSNTTYVIRKD